MSGVYVSVLARFDANAEDPPAHMGSLLFASSLIDGEGLLRHMASRPTQAVASLVKQPEPTWALEEASIVADMALATTKRERSAVKLRIPALVPGKFRGRRRIKAECLERQIVGHDFDEVVAASWDAVVEHVRQQLPDRFLVMHTTASERTAEGAWRVRVYEILDRPASPAVWDAHVKTHMRALGEHDPQALDVARLLYVPINTAGYRFAIIEGPRTRLDDIIALAPAEVVPAKVSAGAAETSSCSAPAPSLRRSAAKLIGENWPPPGNRCNARLALAGACFYQRWSEAEGVEFVRDVHAHVVDRRDATDDVLAEIVRSSFAKGAAGEPVMGFRKLAEHGVPAAIVQAAWDLLGYVAEARAAFRLECGSSVPSPPVSGVLPSKAANDSTPAPAPASTPPAKAKRISASERALRVGGQGKRLTTGLPTIDTACRGGLLLRKVVAIGGAPGAGKTALAVQLAYRWLSDGVHVAFFAADEDADALLIRFGQLLGLSRDALEAGDPAERAKLAAWCSAVRLILIDGDEDETIEQVSRDLRDAAKGEPSALIVDSLQTARTAKGAPNGADVRARINVTVAALKAAAKVDGHLVVATSELARGAYRNKSQAENISPLSAFKESGDIEYGVGLALVLTSRHGTSELVDAVVAKNRLGPGKPELMLRLDHARAGVSETTAADAEMTDPLYFTKIDVLAEVARGHAMTRTKIYGQIGGKKSVVVRAINELLESRRLFDDPRGLRPPQAGDPGFPVAS